VLRIIREILLYRPVNKKTDIERTLRFLNDVVKRKAIVFLISDFIGQNYEKILRVTNKKHDCIPIVLSDPREKKLPDIGLMEMQDSETGERILVHTGDRSFRESYEKLIQEEDSKRRNLFRKVGVDSIDIWSDKPYVSPLYTFFKMRSRRAGRLS
jgi:hypothetical protein